ncbi:MAG TPA: SulP family inorganic anion transporter [Acidimicrobiales bacterium]|nr:SulP family inorganic anion transporter [Acidimicrobiales bacterium]
MTASRPPSQERSGPTLLGRFPVPEPLSSLRGYRRGWLGADLLAALTLLVIAVPEQLATSRLAGMPPITGLYTFIAGAVAFGFLGASPQLSVGADSTIAPLFATGIAHLAPTGSSDYVALVALVAVVVGALVALVGLLGMGWIANFLSAPIITGFLAGVAVIIVVHQLPDLLGLRPASGSTVHRVTEVVRHLGHTSVTTFVIGAAVFAVVLTAERIDAKLPGALAGLAASTVVVWAAHLEHHGVAVLGTVAHHAPTVGLSHLSWSALGQVFPLAGVVALVVVSQTAATTRAFADQGGYPVDVNRDFIGVGASGVLAGLFGAFATNASPARTAAVASAGGRSQAAGLVAAAAVVLVVPSAGLLTDVPLATLAAILIFVATRIFHVDALAAVLRFDRWEFGLAVVTLLTVALVGVEQGIGVAVGLAILDRTRRSAHPRSYVLGRIDGTTSWEPLGHRDHPVAVPGVVVVQLVAPIYYANADHVRADIKAALADAPGPTSLLVLDADAISDIDFTGTRMLRALLDDLDRARVTVAVARAVGEAPRSLSRSGLGARIGADHIFGTVDEAVTALHGRRDGTGDSRTGDGVPPRA